MRDTSRLVSIRHAHVRTRPRARRKSLPSLLVIVAVGCVLPTSSSASGPTARTAQPRVTRCGFIHASVPYSRRGNRNRWGVYVAGRASCATSKAVLSAVMHLRASAHVGKDNADSYFSYHGWRCAFGQMGNQPCWLPATHPYRAAATALNCDDHPDGGCPARIPHDYLP